MVHGKIIFATNGHQTKRTYKAITFEVRKSDVSVSKRFALVTFRSCLRSRLTVAECILVNTDFVASTVSIDAVSARDSSSLRLHVSPSLGSKTRRISRQSSQLSS